MVKYIVVDDFNNRIKADQSCMGTITTNIGTRAARNGIKLIEMRGTEKVIRKLIDDTNLGFNPIPKVFTEVSSTLRASRYGLKVLEDDGIEIRVRRVTPTECFRLTGFSDEDCKKASEGGISNAQLYKQAGNSIVVNVLEAIFTELGKTYGEFSV